MRKKVAAFLLILFFYLFFPLDVNAVCPVCTVAVGGGVLLSRYLGVDDLIIGVWTGGLLVSLGLWIASYFRKKIVKYQEWLVVGLFWLTTYVGFKQAGFIGHPSCKIYGHDKLLSGMIFGTISFIVGYSLDYLLRVTNHKEPNKARFPYQKVVLPFCFLIIATLFSIQLCKWGIR